MVPTTTNISDSITALDSLPLDSASQPDPIFTIDIDPVTYANVLASDLVSVVQQFSVAVRLSGQRREEFWGVIEAGNDEIGGPIWKIEVIVHPGQDATLPEGGTKVVSARLPRLILLRDVDTRWSSTYLMIERFLFMLEVSARFIFFGLYHAHLPVTPAMSATSAEKSRTWCKIWRCTSIPSQHRHFERYPRPSQVLSRRSNGCVRRTDSDAFRCTSALRAIDLDGEGHGTLLPGTIKRDSRRRDKANGVFGEESRGKVVHARNG